MLSARRITRRRATPFHIGLDSLAASHRGARGVKQPHGDGVSFREEVGPMDRAGHLARPIHFAFRVSSGFRCRPQNCNVQSSKLGRCRSGHSAAHSGIDRCRTGASNSRCHFHRSRRRRRNRNCRCDKYRRSSRHRLCSDCLARRTCTCPAFSRLPDDPVCNSGSSSCCHVGNDRRCPGTRPPDRRRSAARYRAQSGRGSGAPQQLRQDP